MPTFYWGSCPWSLAFYTPICKYAKLALFHCQGLAYYQQKRATYLFIAAKCAIAKAWQSPSVPCSVVKSNLTTLMINKNMSSILHDSHNYISESMGSLVVVCSPHPHRSTSQVSYGIALGHGNLCGPAAPTVWSPSGSSI